MKVFEKELEWQGFLWKRESTSAKAIQKELQIATKEFQDSKIQLGEQQFKIERYKIWIASLMHQIHPITNGDGIISNPIPIDNPTTLPLERPFL